jgi:glucose-6-phosphate isomerase
MSNFFSQPDALAIGKTREELVAEKTAENLLSHKEFPGDRPSLSLLFLGELDAYKCGQLLALYEHRTSVEGFIWDLNSYDQYGVELGKVLAKNVRNILKENGGEVLTKSSLNSATKGLLNEYLAHK